MDNWGEYDIQTDQSNSDTWNGNESDGSDGSDGNEQQFETTFDQQLNSSEQNDCGPLIVKEPGKENEYRKAMAQLDPIERLKQFIGGIVFYLNKNNIFDISSDERNIICRSVDNLNIYNIQAKYVNPLGYILGYVAYNKGFMIVETDSLSKKKKKKLELNRDIFSELTQINDSSGGNTNYSVFPPDVVRYMKLWSRIL
jgi:hypothetical protein